MGDVYFGIRDALNCLKPASEIISLAAKIGMNPILSLSLLNIGKEAVEHLLAKKPLPETAANLDRVPFANYLDNVQAPSPVSGLEQFLKNSGIRNPADLENALIHLIQQLFKDPAFSQFSADAFRTGTFSLHADGRGGTHLTGPNGQRIEFFSHSKPGELARKIRQISMLLEETSSAPNSDLWFLARIIEDKNLSGESWNLQLKLT